MTGTGIKQTGIKLSVDADIMSAAASYREEANAAYERLLSKGMDFCGWVGYAASLTEDDIREIEHVASDIRRKCTTLVCVGIGGSYLGASAALDFVGGGIFKAAMDAPRILFAGFNLSGSYHRMLLNEIRDEEVCICHISKSGGTVEPGMAFSVLRGFLIEKYGEAGADERTYAITDPVSGKLRKEAEEKGWMTLPIPSDIGGRFSVLTPVGLLPLAVSGMNIRKLLAGAVSAGSEELSGLAVDLACARAAVKKSGKTTELIACFEPYLESLIQWMLQLFGESEGKEHKGMLPQGLSYSRDLHSLGQFIQEGTRSMSEILLSVEEAPADVRAPDGGDIFAGRTMNEFNDAVRAGVMAAHREADVPLISISLPGADEYSLGQFIYFCELCCGVSGLLLGVNPFDQPGVEAYKREMMAVL